MNLWNVLRVKRGSLRWGGGGAREFGEEELKCEKQMIMRNGFRIPSGKNVVVENWLFKKGWL